MGVNNGQTIIQTVKATVAPATALGNVLVYNVPANSLLIVEHLYCYMYPFGAAGAATGLIIAFINSIEVARIFNPTGVGDFASINMGQMYVQGGENVVFQWSNAGGGVNTFMQAGFKGRLLA